MKNKLNKNYISKKIKNENNHEVLFIGIVGFILFYLALQLYGVVLYMFLLIGIFLIKKFYM
jgi:hypothetical protein